MEITWFGHACVRLKGKETTVICDPCPPSSGYRLEHTPADIVTVSHAAAGHTSVESVGGTPRQ